ncbi:MAG TPA: YdbL family protein [Rhodanobacter sp.]|nr:YdbL family protein [Rhodanobacter sp.]
MRKSTCFIVALLAVVLAGCVTINVYFPEASAQKAADQFVGNVLGATPAKPQPAPVTPPPAKSGPSASVLDLLIPAAQAADAPNLRIQTPAVQAIQARMRTRFETELQGLLDSGAAGFTNDGMVALRDAAKVPLAQRAQAAAAVADENRDRAALYREIADANAHPEWEAQIRATFAKTWIERAHAGWYYQDAGGNWQRK